MALVISQELLLDTILKTAMCFYNPEYLFRSESVLSAVPQINVKVTSLKEKKKSEVRIHSASVFSFWTKKKTRNIHKT